MQEAQKGANEELDSESKQHHKALELQPGDKIYLRRDQSVEVEGGKMPFIEPFVVIASHDFTLQISKGEKISLRGQDGARLPTKYELKESAARTPS